MDVTEGSGRVGAQVPAGGARDRARKRLQQRRDFGAHVVVFAVVNCFLIGMWAVTGAGYFWPIWVIASWGIGLVLHAWETFWHRPVTEADVDAELRRHPG